MSMKMTMAEFVGLEPCPFCGGEAQTLRIGSWWCVACRTPFCCDVGKFDTEAEAIKAWNTRAERTCKNVYEGSDIDRYMMFKCSNCGCVLANHYYPKGWIEQELTDDEFFAYDGERLNYCPNCGAKVVD